MLLADRMLRVIHMSRRISSPIALVVGLLAVILVSASVGLAQPSLEDNKHFTRETALDSSDFLLAVVTKDGQATCKNYGTETICLQPMKIVELIGGAQNGQPWPQENLEVTVFAGRNSPPPPNDERHLITAIPSKDTREAYVMRHSGPATPETIAAARRALGNYGRTLKCPNATTYLVSNGDYSTCATKPGVSVRCDDGHGNYAGADCATGCLETGGGGSCTIPDLPPVKHEG